MSSAAARPVPGALRALRSLGSLWLGTLVLAGCTAAPRPAAPARPAPETAPWRLPPDASPSQRLFRLTVESTEDRASLRAVLRLEAPARYRLTLSDRLGRTLYTLDAAPAGGRLLDHREKRACPFGEEGVLRGIPLDPLRPEALAAVLLGRVPAGPAGPVDAAGSGELAYRDRRGRRWKVRLEADGSGGRRVASWTLHRGGEPVLWWRRDGGEALLSDRQRGVQIRWREVAREPLAEPLSELTIPPGFEAGPCPAAGEGPGAGRI